jgi:DNA-binding GntR family transcriptional regulator
MSTLEPRDVVDEHAVLCDVVEKGDYAQIQEIMRKTVNPFSLLNALIPQVKLD